MPCIAFSFYNNFRRQNVDYLCLFCSCHVFILIFQSYMELQIFWELEESILRREKFQDCSKKETTQGILTTSCQTRQEKFLLIIFGRIPYISSRWLAELLTGNYIGRTIKCNSNCSGVQVFHQKLSAEWLVEVGRFYEMSYLKSNILRTLNGNLQEISRNIQTKTGGADDL